MSNRSITQVFFVAATVLLTACATGMSSGDSGEKPRDWESSSRAEVVAVLDEQAAAWNRGDLEAFMEGYWKSPELVFTSGGRVRRGWQTTLDRYRATYGTAPETMGQLSFIDVEVHPVSGSAAWVLGTWRLDRRSDRLGGVFSLVFRRIDGEWRIVHDHTSLAPDE